MFSFSPKRLFAVTKKESQEMMRNWLSLMLSIVAPIILYFLFAYGMPLDVKNIPMAVLDEDKSPESRRLIDTFVSGKVFKVMKLIQRFEDIDPIMRRGDIRLCLVIPPEFSKTNKKGKPQQLMAVVDAIYTNRASMSSGYADSTIAAFNQEQLGIFFLKELGPSYGAGTGLPVDLYISPWFNPTFRSEDFVVPGVIAVILVFLPPTIMAISISREKETGSILNMFCSPVTKTEFIIGKAIPYIAITYFNFLLFLGFTVFIFMVPLRGSLALLCAVSFIYVVAVVGIGVIVAVLVRTQIAAILITAVANLIPSFMYSGFMLPVICMEDSARQTAYSIPPTYYISFIRKLMLKGVGIEFLGHDILALGIMAFVLFAVSIILFKKKLD